ncbi:MAG: T9SS type A sorting domain-containing protein [Candidatus Zixiibacteriota bacterium]
MKGKILVLIAAMMAMAITASAQQDPKDNGAADSVILSFGHLPDLMSGDSLVVVEIYGLCDSALASISPGFQWNVPEMDLDTGFFSPTAAGAFNLTQLVYYRNNKDSSNNALKFQTVGLRIFGPGLLPGRHLLATFRFHLTAEVDSIVVDSSLFNKFAFVTVANNEFVPRFAGPIVYKLPQDVEQIETGSLPTSFDLAQNYPNPFNPETTFEFALPKASQVELAIFNVLGQRVITLINERLDAGTYRETWRGTSENGGQVASGIYFYRLTAGDFVSTRKMMLLK